MQKNGAGACRVMSTYTCMLTIVHNDGTSNNRPQAFTTSRYALWDITWDNSIYAEKNFTCTVTNNLCTHHARTCTYTYMYMQVH